MRHSQHEGWKSLKQSQRQEEKLLPHNNRLFGDYYLTSITWTSGEWRKREIKLLALDRFTPDLLSMRLRKSFHGALRRQTLVFHDAKAKAGKLVLSANVTANFTALSS